MGIYFSGEIKLMNCNGALKKDVCLIVYGIFLLIFRPPDPPSSPTYKISSFSRLAYLSCWIWRSTVTVSPSAIVCQRTLIWALMQIKYARKNRRRSMMRNHSTKRNSQKRKISSNRSGFIIY